MNRCVPRCLVPAVVLLSMALLPWTLFGQEKKPEVPDKIYVPYDKLKRVFEKQDQGIFLPYRDFEKLWQLAQGRPADARMRLRDRH